MQDGHQQELACEYTRPQEMLEQLGMGGGDLSPQQQQQQYGSSSPEALPSFLSHMHEDAQARSRNWHNCGHNAFACQSHQPVCCCSQQQQQTQHICCPQQQAYPYLYDCQMIPWPVGQQFSYPSYPHQLTDTYIHPPPPTYTYIPVVDAVNYHPYP